MSSLTNDARKSFVESSADRSLEIVHDNDLHRHLKCHKVGTGCMGYSITTWPGHLAISGDMGCYVFARIPDMFDFFRGDGINDGYWAEKVQAADKCDGLREFDSDAAREWVAEQVKTGGGDIDTDGINYEDGVVRFHDSLPNDDVFSDSYHHGFDRYTFRYLWCCFAIVWAIKEYDRQKKLAAMPVAVIA